MNALLRLFPLSFLSLGLAAAAQPAAPATMTIAPPLNVLHLSAASQVETPQDLLTLSLSTTRQGAEAAGVQAALRQAVEQALTEAKKSVQAGQMDARSGDFSVHPSYNRDGKISGWQGRAEVVLEGRDFARITQTAARIGSMSIGQISFGLSREQRARVEAEAQAQAIAQFRQKAAEVAKAFGFAGYTLREVTVSGDGAMPQPRLMAMAKEMRAAAADAPVPVEPGKSVVQVTVSGAVQAH